MPEATPIDRLYSDAKAVVESLGSLAELSLQTTTADHFRKVLLLAAASYFEYRICNSVLDFVREQSRESPLVVNFVKNKAVSRQYHTWFPWEAKNANQFYALFGGEFKATMTARIEEIPSIQESVKAFLELGNERNKLVHQNYVTFPMEKTLDEVYDLYKRASEFVDMLPSALRTQ